jgi:hypothetical protein
MAKAVILDIKSVKVSSIKTADSNRVKISDSKYRVKFINIGIEGSGTSGAAPIGIAIIGYNNYIL